ncbi:MAG: hypothetical protein WCA10_20125 [Terracidiphilus sp.]
MVELQSRHPRFCAARTVAKHVLFAIAGHEINDLNQYHFPSCLEGAVAVEKKAIPIPKKTRSILIAGADGHCQTLFVV